jgi:hypothetical protein
MAKINMGRMFASVEGDYVVFLIGMRINSFWKINKWFPAILEMPKMLKELFANKEHGFLAAESWFGRTTIMVQYWRSFEHLEKYARDKSLNHYPAWKRFNQRTRSSKAVGVWHETYKAGAGSYENIYVNMPPFGLGKAGMIRSITGKNENAKQRITENV